MTSFQKSCPFCEIASASTLNMAPVRSSDASLPANVFLSTPTVLGFLDIQPLVTSAGAHMLITPREHYETLDLVPSNVAADLGALLPQVVKAFKNVLKNESASSQSTAANTGDDDEEISVNVIQNNGSGAGQIVPHVHFHIVPRSTSDPQTRFLARSIPMMLRSETSNKPGIDWVTSFKNRLSYAAQVFGRGQREDLDDEWCEEFVSKLKNELARLNSSKL